MFKEKFLRCVASLMLCIYFCGTISPAVVYAENFFIVNKLDTNEELEPTDVDADALGVVKYGAFATIPGAEAPTGSDLPEGDFGFYVKPAGGSAQYVFAFSKDLLERGTDCKFSYDGLVDGTSASTVAANDICTKITDETYGDFFTFTDTINKEINSSQGASAYPSITNLNQRFAVHVCYALHWGATNDNGNDYKLLHKDKYVDFDNLTGKAQSLYDIINMSLKSSTEESLSDVYEDVGIDMEPLPTNPSGGITWNKVQVPADMDPDLSSNKKAIKNYERLQRYYFTEGRAFYPGVAESINYTGVLGCTLMKRNVLYNYCLQSKDTTYAANTYAAYNCIKEYAQFQRDTLEDIYMIADWQNNEAVKTKLLLAKMFYDTFHKYVPVIKDIYEAKNVNAGNMSIKTMCEKCELDNASETRVSDVKLDSLQGVEYKPNEDDSTPLGMFYTVNSEEGILMYDRDAILADIEVDTTQDILLESEIEAQRKVNDTNLVENFALDNVFLVDQISVAQDWLDMIEGKKGSVDDFYELYTSPVSDRIKEVMLPCLPEKQVKVLDTCIEKEDKKGLYEFVKEQTGIPRLLHIILDSTSLISEEDLARQMDETAKAGQKLKPKKAKDGVTDSLGAVTINEMIVEGMGYSATYIPMKTNLYSADTYTRYDEDFKQFWLKYGNMRKALYKDTSGSAAVDYYTAGGKCTGMLSVCTLRDLIELGDNDIVLYIDPSFYNADDAIKQGEEFRQAALSERESMYAAFSEYLPLWRNSRWYHQNVSIAFSSIHTPTVVNALANSIDGETEQDMQRVNIEEFNNNFKLEVQKLHNFNFDKIKSAQDLADFNYNLSYALEQSGSVTYDYSVLKTGEYDTYSDTIKVRIDSLDDSQYKSIDLSDGLYNTDDNADSIVMTSRQIKETMDMISTYSSEKENKEKNEVVTNNYTVLSRYSPRLSLAFVSLLYRQTNYFVTAQTVESNNPVFIASKNLCGIAEANQWYRNSLLNYALIRNIKGNVQIDYAYVCDLDCPVYMDIFGNILTESGTVVVPAASNATLHPGSFKNANYSVGLYSCYGKEYYLPLDTKGAYSVLYPYFVADHSADKFVLNAITVNLNGGVVRMDKINQYDTNVQSALIDLYKKYISPGKTTRLNWMAMVKIVNEVMRGAPQDSINKDTEKLYTTATKNRAGAIAAIKLEEMLGSLRGQMSNTLLCIPDFSRVDNLEVWVALLIKLMCVATCAVIIVMIYRDGVSNNLGLRTLFKSLSAIALAVSCIVVVPSVFQLSYYTANKLLLESEALRILMVNEEKRQCGVEICMTEVNHVNTENDFSLQLDWITVPWYEQVDQIMFESTLDNLQKVKLEAYRNSSIYNNSDVETYNDGVYVTIPKLFDSVSIDYTFKETENQGLYLYANDKQQTAGFYSPYYVFLRVLVANINEYNSWRGNAGDEYSSQEEAQAAGVADPNLLLSNMDYTTKYVSGNRLKTVGLCEDYFTSESFMKNDVDIMRLYQIYGSLESDDPDDYRHGIKARETYAFDRSLLFSDEEVAQFRASMWYNSYDADNTLARAQVMDQYARDFIAKNKDLLTKVTDETFIKTMALAMAVKYNQLYGVSSANSIEIYNLDSEELIRLCLVKSEDAVYSIPMSYPRFVYNFGGELGVYLATVLSLIMYVGSFIKPLCTVIVFISVFLSIFIFRVCLRKPSANLYGYLVTITLLCVTNFAHAVILKLGVMLPSFGLPTVACLLFLIVGQVVYLLILAYVTGVSLKDWANLGASEYEKEARILKSKFKNEDVNSKLNGNVKHHEDNWDYYTDLVVQHRQRNKH